MTTTLADIQKSAETRVRTFVDEVTPAGHFGATTTIYGHTTTFLLEGEKDAADAVVKGRVLIKTLNGRTTAIGFSGGGLDGGNGMGRALNYTDAFAQMVHEPERFLRKPSRRILTTLAELATASNSTLDTFTDDTLPAGHFGATVFVDGDLRGYVLKGEKDNPEAVVRGRIEYGTEENKLVLYAFAQGGITGGVPLGEVTDVTDALVKMGLIKFSSQ